MNRIDNENLSYNNFSTIRLNPNLFLIRDFLGYNLPKITIDKLPSNQKYKLVSNGQSIIKKLDLSLHPISYIEYMKLLGLASKANGPSFSADDVIRMVDQYTKKLHPFNIPIVFMKNSRFDYGECCPVYIGDNNNLKLYFTEFRMSNYLSNLTPSIYIHEIMHSQLESTKSAVEDYINYEVLTTFFDRLTAYYLDDSGQTTRVNELLRLKILYQALTILGINDISDIGLIKSSMTVNSLLKSEQLYRIYINGESTTRKSIINDIQLVFDGEMAVEELLNNNDITLENSQDFSLIKKIVEKR